MKKGVLIIIAAALVAVVFYGIRYASMPVDTMVAEAKTMEKRISGEGIIVYDESVYNAANTGTFYSYTDEGVRVGKQRCIATVYNGVVDKEVLQQLGNLDKKIMDLSENDDSFFSDSSSGEAVIENVKANIIEDVIDGDMSKMSEYKNKIKNVSGADTASEDAKSLEAEKEGIEARISQTRKDIYSDISGIFTTSLDGLEGLVKPSDLAWYMAADYKNLPEPKTAIMGNRTVKSGEPVCKVVDNHVWYVIMVISKEDCEKLKVGADVKLRISDLPGDNVDAKIDYISPEPDGAEEYLISVKSERYLEGVFNTRKSDMEIILNSYYGFEMPITALCVKDGKNGVMVKTSNNEELFKECKILYRNDDEQRVIVEPEGEKVLKDGDKIILGEK